MADPPRFRNAPALRVSHGHGISCRPGPTGARPGMPPMPCGTPAGAAPEVP